MKNLDLTTGSIPKRLTQLTLPMMLGIISMVAFNLIDTYFVGQLGKRELAALSFTFPVIMVIFSVVQGLGIGATALISQSIGKGKIDKARRETTDSLLLGVMIAGVFILLGLATMEPIFRLIGVSEDLMPLVTSYMTIWYLAVFFVTIPFIGNSAIRAVGDARTPSFIMLFAVLINAILDPILIFGWGPIPSMGLRGAAIATAISRSLTMVLSLYILYYRERLVTLSIPTLDILRGCWKAILGIALPSSASRLVVPVATGIITAFLAQYGDHAVAAFGVGSRLEFLAMSVLFALAASIGPFAGQNLGKNNILRIRQCLNISARFSIIYGLALWLILALVARPIAEVFSEDPKVVEVVVWFLYILPASFGMQGVTSAVNSSLNTIGRPMPAFWIILIQMIAAAVPLVYFGSLLFDELGIFGGLTIAYLIGGVLSLVLHHRYLRQLEQPTPA
ncbi:MAG: MATE family efflux transporter [Bacteroidota bacterium]